MGTKYPDCVVCGEELYEPQAGVDNWMDDNDDIETSFIVREMECTNEDCPLHGKQQDVFFDYSRIDVEGDEIDIDELKEKLKGHKD